MAFAAVDANQKAEVAALRKMGYAVALTSSLGKGMVDFIVGGRGVNLLVELKIDGKAKLTPHEHDFHQKWKGPILIATSADQIHAEMLRLSKESC